MTTAYTSLLGLALPVTGELSGTWGDVVNNYITSYVDASVAGAQTISGSQTAVTLSTTNGSALSQAASGATGSAQYQIINCTGNPASLLTITAPATSKTYIVINATSTTQSVKIVGSGPTTGVTVVSGEKALVAWNGSDFTKVASSLAVIGPASATDNAFTRFDGTTGVLVQNSTGATLDDTGAPTFTGTVTVNGTSSTAGGIVLGEDTDNGSNTLTIKAAAAMAGNITLVMPDTDGDASQVLTTDGSGNLTWTTPSSGVSLSADNTWTGTQSFTGTSSKMSSYFTNAKEKVTVSATAATGTINYDITTQSVLYYTTNASANWTTNLRASSGTTLDATMSTGESITVAFLVTQGTTAYYNSAVQVDGTTSGVTTKWQGGTAPTSGNVSSIDAYVYTVIKTGSATFTVLASQTQFA